MIRRPPRSTLFPTRRSSDLGGKQRQIMVDIKPGLLQSKGLSATDVVAAVGQQNLVLPRSEEHTSELQSRLHLVCRLLLEKKNKRGMARIVGYMFSDERESCV